MMRPALFAAALLATATALPAVAASSTSSAVSDSASTSVGSVSNSLERSSDSSRNDERAAAGEYRVAGLAPAAGRPGMVRMTLQAVADAPRQFLLVLPQQAVDAERIEPGLLVSVKRQAWGLAFAHQATQRAFFLVLEDAWLRELQTTPVRL